jgi:MFS family permease
MKKKTIIRALTVFVMLVAFRAATTCIAPLINNLLIEQGYSFSDQALISGIVLCVGYLATIVGSMVGGRFADKMGPERTILIAGSVFAGCYMIWSFANAGIMLYINRVILALCTGALYVALQSYILGGVKKGSEGMAMGIYGLSFGIGTAIAGTAAGMADSIGIRNVFLTMGIVCIGAVLLGGTATRIDKRLPIPEGVEPAMKKAAASMSTVDVLKKSRGAFWLLLGNAVLYGFGLIIFLQYLDELGAARGLEGTTASFGIAVFSILSLFQPLTGLIADKIGKANCTLLGQVLITVGWILLSLMPQLSLGMALIFSAIAGVGAALYSPAVLAIAELSAPEGSGGTIRGIYQGANSLGSAIAAIFGSITYMNIGSDNVFLLLVGSCTLGLLTALVLVRVSKK